MRTLHGWWALAVLATATATASADDKSAEADRKFEEAQKLRDQGKVKEACEKFAAALSLNPNAIGTILNVARCAEEQGKTGSAVRWFTEARDRAREQGLDPQRQAAEDHLSKLVSHVPHLAIAFTEPPPADARILVDDHLIDKDAANDVAVDPGSVKVVVSAPGRVSFVTTIEFDPKGDHEHKAIAVPKLGYPVTVKSTRKTVAKIFTFSGGAMVVGSVGLALFARSKYNNAVNDTAHCNMTSDGRTICDSQNFQKASDARTYGNVATGVGIAGAALAAAGVALWFVVPSHDERLAVLPVLDPTQPGLAAVGRF